MLNASIDEFSGIQLRSRSDPHGRAMDYQADIVPAGPWWGALCDGNSGRKMRAI
jgi:hypothetical protein